MAQPPPIKCSNCGRILEAAVGQSEVPSQCVCGAPINAIGAPANPSPQQTAGTGPGLDIPMENQPVTFGPSVPCAYQPSGVAGNMATLVLYSILGTVVGLAVGLACGAIGAGITYVHSLLPVFIFIVPIFVLLLIAATPAITAAVVGAVLARGVSAAKCRSIQVASAFGIGAGSLSVAALVLIGDRFAPQGLIHFIRLLVGGSFHFQWGANFEPINVPAWIIYGVIVISGFLGVIVAKEFVSEHVKSTPYCENCDGYLDRQILWSIMPAHLEPMMDALDRTDVAAVQNVPICPAFDNRVEVVLWVCDCNEDQYVELYGHSLIRTKDGEQRPAPVRVYSAPLAVKEAEVLLEHFDNPQSNER